RDRPCGHFDLRDPSAAAAVVANLDQPICGGDDALCRRLRRHVPSAAYRSSVDGLLSLPAAEYDGDVAELPQPVDVGRVCGHNLCDGLGVVLVYGLNPGFRLDARSGEENVAEDRLWNAGDGLAR